MVSLPYDLPEDFERTFHALDKLTTLLLLDYIIEDEGPQQVISYKQ